MKYDTPKQYLRRLYLERFATYLKYLALSFISGIALFIIYICLTSNNDVGKINEYLKTHDLEYCNNNVR